MQHIIYMQEASGQPHIEQYRCLCLLQGGGVGWKWGGGGVNACQLP